MREAVDLAHSRGLAARPIRNGPVTADLNYNRVNLYVNDAGTIERVEIG